MSSKFYKCGTLEGNATESLQPADVG